MHEIAQKRLEQYVNCLVPRVDEPYVLARIGDGPTKLVINVGTHGNEVVPLIAVQHALRMYAHGQFSGSALFTVANPMALHEYRRYRDFDLNRIYPGNMQGRGEEVLAAHMLDITRDVPFVVDMHTAPEGPPFAIIVKPGEKELQLAEMMGIGRIVLLSIIKDPHSLIGFAPCGAGVELGGHQEYAAISQGEILINRLLKGLDIVNQPLSNLGYYEYYQMVGVVPRDQKFDQEELYNFEPISGSIFNRPEATLFPALVHRNDNELPYAVLLKKVTRQQLLDTA